MRHSMIVAIGILMITSLCWAQAQPGEPVQLPAPEVGQANAPAPAPSTGEVTNATPPPPQNVAPPPAQPAGTPEAGLLQRALDKIEVAKQQMAEMRGKNSQLEADNQRLAARPTTVVNKYGGGPSHRSHRASAAPSPRPTVTRTWFENWREGLRTRLKGIEGQIAELWRHVVGLEDKMGKLEKLHPELFQPTPSASSTTPAPTTPPTTTPAPEPQAPAPQVPGQPPTQDEVAPGPQVPGPQAPAPGQQPPVPGQPTPPQVPGIQPAPAPAPDEVNPAPNQVVFIPLALAVTVGVVDQTARNDAKRAQDGVDNLYAWTGSVVAWLWIIGIITVLATLFGGWHWYTGRHRLCMICNHPWHGSKECRKEGCVCHEFTAARCTQPLTPAAETLAVHPDQPPAVAPPAAPPGGTPASEEDAPPA